MGVEGVAGRSGQAVRQVVDELHLAGQRPLDPVSHLSRTRECLRRAGAEALRVDLCLYLPLHAVLCARHCGGPDRRRCQRPQVRRVFRAERVEGHDRDLRGWLRRRWAELRVERLEQRVGRGHQSHAAHPERDRRRARSGREQYGLTNLRLKGRGELLVQHDLPAAQPAVEYAERGEMVQVVVGDGEDRTDASPDRASAGDVARRRERRGRDR